MSDARQYVQAAQDLRQLRDAAEKAGLSALLRQVLEGKVSLSEALPPAQFEMLQSPPRLMIPQSVPAYQRWTYQATQARKLLNYLCRAFATSDRHKALEWFVAGLRETASRRDTGLDIAR